MHTELLQWWIYSNLLYLLVLQILLLSSYKKKIEKFWILWRVGIDCELEKKSSSANVTDNTFTMVTILYIFFHCLKSNIVIALNMPYITSTDNPQCWVIEVAKSGKFRNCLSCIQVSGLHNKSPLPLGTFLVRIHPLLHL